MKKQAITLVFLLVLLVGGLVTLKMLGDSSPDSSVTATEASENIIMGGIPAPSVSKIIIKNNLLDETTEIAVTYPAALSSQPDTQNSEDSEQYTADNIIGDLDKIVLKSLVGSARNLVARQTVALSPADISQFGLDYPRAEFSAEYSDASPKTISIGNDAPGDSGVYVLAQNDVYLVDQAQINNLLLGSLGYAAKVITPGQNADPHIDKLVISGSKYDAPITIVSSAEDLYAAATGELDYKIITPFEQNSTAQDMRVLEQIYGLTATEVVTQTEITPDVLTLYGLDQPYIQFYVESRPDNLDGSSEEPEFPPFTVWFSRPENDDPSLPLYVASSSGHHIYKIAAAQDIPFFDYGTFNIVDKRIVSPKIEELESIVITVFNDNGSKTAEMKFSGDADNITLTINESEADIQNFRRFFDTLVATEYESPVDDLANSPDPSLQPIMNVVYKYYFTGDIQTVRFGEGPARRVLVSVDDGLQYYSKTTYLDRIIADFDKLLAGLPVEAATYY